MAVSLSSIRDFVLAQLPADGSTVGNRKSIGQLEEAYGADFGEESYWQVRDELVEENLVGKGRGRGGSICRLSSVSLARPAARGDEDDSFALTPQEQQAQPKQAAMKLGQNPTEGFHRKASYLIDLPVGKALASLVLALCALTLPAAPAVAATFDVQTDIEGQPGTVIVSMRGEIEQGDLAGLLDVVGRVRKQGKFPRNLILGPSRGGNLHEAMAIGHAISMLTPKVTVVDHCFSACAVIALSAQHRVFLGTLGLHRPYFDPDYYSGLSSGDADKRYRALLLETKQYLRENYVPESVIEKMFRASSTDMWTLPPSEARRVLGNNQPPFEEWVKARCPHSSDSASAAFAGVDPSCFNKQLGQAQRDGMQDFIDLVMEQLN